MAVFQNHNVKNEIMLYLAKVSGPDEEPSWAVYGPQVVRWASLLYSNKCELHKEKVTTRGGGVAFEDCSFLSFSLTRQIFSKF